MLWITGAKGLLGTALSVKCKAALHLSGAPKDASSLGCCIAALHSGHEVDIGDARQVRGYIETHPGITHIVNCAAFSLVDAAEEQREEAYRANVLGPENLARVAQEIGARLIHISTDYVFPGTGRRPLTENDPVAPCNYYGQTKLEGEQRALALSACVIRISALFGDGGKNFVSKLLQLLLTPREVQLVDDQWNRFTYAPDLSDAILQLLDHKGLYHYANQGVVTKYEFGIAMRDYAIELGYPVKASLRPVPGTTFPSPCKRPIYSAFDTAKVEAFVSIRPWQEALREFLCAQMPVSL